MALMELGLLLVRRSSARVNLSLRQLPLQKKEFRRPRKRGRKEAPAQEEEEKEEEDTGNEIQLPLSRPPPPDLPAALLSYFAARSTV